MADLHRLRAERDDLTQKQTDELGERLRQALAGLTVLGEELAGLESQAIQYPLEARQEPAKLQALVQAARQSYRARDEALSQARQERGLLESQREQRERLQQEFLQLDEELNHAELLAKLLSRDWLQRHLVRTAERQVVDHANAVLDRLSGGTLYLRLA